MWFFNDAVNTFHLCSYSDQLMVKDYSDSNRKEIFDLTTHSTHFIYGYMASDIWQRIVQIAIEEIHCRQGYSFRIAARNLLNTPSHKQDRTYKSFYTSCEALAGTRNSSWIDHEGSVTSIPNLSNVYN